MSDLELSSLEEISHLKSELDNVGKRKDVSTKELNQAVDKLSKIMSSMLEVFGAAANELRLEEKEYEADVRKQEHIVTKLDKILDQNKTMANGMVAIVDMVKEKIADLEREEKAFIKKTVERKVTRKPEKLFEPEKHEMHLEAPKPIPKPVAKPVETPAEMLSPKPSEPPVEMHETHVESHAEKSPFEAQLHESPQVTKETHEVHKTSYYQKPSSYEAPMPQRAHLERSRPIEFTPEPVHPAASHEMPTPHHDIPAPHQEPPRPPEIPNFEPPQFEPPKMPEMEPNFPPPPSEVHKAPEIPKPEPQKMTPPPMPEPNFEPPPLNQDVPPQPTPQDDPFGLDSGPVPPPPPQNFESGMPDFGNDLPEPPSAPEPKKKGLLGGMFKKK